MNHQSKTKNSLLAIILISLVGTTQATIFVDNTVFGEKSSSHPALLRRFFSIEEVRRGKLLLLYDYLRALQQERTGEPNQSIHRDGSGRFLPDLIRDLTQGKLSATALYAKVQEAALPAGFSEQEKNWVLLEIEKLLPYDLTVLSLIHELKTAQERKQHSHKLCLLFGLHQEDFDSFVQSHPEIKKLFDDIIIVGSMNNEAKGESLSSKIQPDDIVLVGETTPPSVSADKIIQYTEFSAARDKLVRRGLLKPYTRTQRLRNYVYNHPYIVATCGCTAAISIFLYLVYR